MNSMAVTIYVRFICLPVATSFHSLRAVRKEEDGGQNYVCATHSSTNLIRWPVTLIWVQEPLYEPHFSYDKSSIGHSGQRISPLLQNLGVDSPFAAGPRALDTSSQLPDPHVPNEPLHLLESSEGAPSSITQLCTLPSSYPF